MAQNESELIMFHFVKISNAFISPIKHLHLTHCTSFVFFGIDDYENGFESQSLKVLSCSPALKLNIHDL